ncbi:hypothetical protein [Leptospira yasudae]|uniref:GIY-YIG domain-containing protein n=1 Tax=Leptospira yasudae TaxID=2202201 RepID=A0ABX9M0G4_9LEPT|nr:hypothetical protein [Leptospira yasudae]RHX78776.1 hypothetical protein DLM77_17095 [Leptospira yasudae]
MKINIDKRLSKLVEDKPINLNLLVERWGNKFRIRKESLPEKGGLYAFWWIGNVEVLKNSERKIELSGPRKIRIPVEFELSWIPREIKGIPLYIGKNARNLKSRVKQHLLLGANYHVHKKIENEKSKPKTTSCQLRLGIEHLFPNEVEIRDFLLANVGITYIELNGSENTVDRFFLEDLAIGLFRPWFNVDSER